MFGSKDVCILKMTIDFNGSMHRTLSDPQHVYMYIYNIHRIKCMYAVVVSVNIYVYTYARTFVHKQICAKGKKKKRQRHLIFEKGSTSV